jgi:type II secretory pathway pseudopilin PulG
MKTDTLLPLRRASVRAREVLHSNSGAFDLPSILVGVVVVGILTAGVLASIFGIIPFAQDKAAQQDAAAVRTAEGVAMAKDGKYMDTAGLIAAGYLTGSTATAAGEAADSGGFVRAASTTPQMSYAAGVDTNHSCFLVTSRSASGAMFFISNSNPEPQQLTATTPVPCISRTDLKTLVDSVGGFGDGSTVFTGPVFNTLSWTPGTTSATLQSQLAVSSDGMKVLSVENGAYLYLASDGKTMIQQTSLGTPGWTGVPAVSADGMHLAASAWNGNYNTLYTSQDGGSTWSSKAIPNTGYSQWATLAMSQDGSKLIAGSRNGAVFTSSDSGATWSQASVIGDHYWNSANVSGSGLMSIVGDNQLFTSQDAGATWSQKALPAYVSALVTDGGNRMFTYRYDGSANYTWTSTDAGATWTPNANVPGSPMRSLASSTDVSKLVAATDSGPFTSTDGGATWTQQNGSPGTAFSAVASSSDGARIIGATGTGGLYVGTWGQ